MIYSNIGAAPDYFQHYLQNTKNIMSMTETKTNFLQNLILTSIAPFIILAGEVYSTRIINHNINGIETRFQEDIRKVRNDIGNVKINVAKMDGKLDSLIKLDKKR